MSLADTLGEGTTKPDDVVKIEMVSSPLSSTSHAKNLGEVQPRVAMKLGEQVNLPNLRTQGVRLIKKKRSMRLLSRKSVKLQRTAETTCGL